MATPAQIEFAKIQEAVDGAGYTLTTLTLELEGEVISVKAGYAFVSVPGFGEIFCPGSKYDGLLMEKGLRIRFKPAFSARGAIVTKPKRAT